MRTVFQTIDQESLVGQLTDLLVNQALLANGSPSNCRRAKTLQPGGGRLATEQRVYNVLRRGGRSLTWMRRAAKINRQGPGDEGQTAAKLGGEIELYGPITKDQPEKPRCSKSGRENQAKKAGQRGTDSKSGLNKEKNESTNGSDVLFNATAC